MVAKKPASKPAARPAPSAPAEVPPEPVAAVAGAADIAGAMLEGADVEMCPMLPDLPPSEVLIIAIVNPQKGKPATRLGTLRPSELIHEDVLLEKFGKEGIYRITPMIGNRLAHPSVEYQVGLSREAHWGQEMPPQLSGLMISLMREHYEAMFKELGKFNEMRDSQYGKQLQFVGESIRSLGKGPDDRIFAMLDEQRKALDELRAENLKLRDKAGKGDDLNLSEMLPHLPDILAQLRGRSTEPRPPGFGGAPKGPAGGGGAAAPTVPASWANDDPMHPPTAEEFRAARERGELMKPAWFLRFYQAWKLGVVPPDLLAELGPEFVALIKWVVEQSGAAGAVAGGA